VHDGAGDRVGTAVVQEPLQSRDVAPSRQNDHAEDFGVAHDVRDEFQRGPVDTAVVTLDDLERDAGRRGSGRAPLLFEVCSDDRVDVEVNSANGIGVEREAVQQGPFGDEVVGVDETTTRFIRMFMVAARPLTASKARSSRTYCLFSRINAMYMKGPTTAMIHAPSVNLTIRKIRTTIEVTVAESAFTKTPKRHLPVLSRRCLATIPAPASVNPVNTPIAYSATSAFTLALKTMIKVSATMPSTMMPLEKASRCPRFVN